MALFNYATKEITLKIVYYGPGLSGKTTNIEYLHSTFDPKRRGKLLSLSTESDRTLFFDFLPVEIGNIRDFSIRFQLYTVPGQIKYNSTRKLVLRGADAVVFVADSQKEMKDANIESFENMKENLVANDIDPDDIPVVLQYNKRDLSDVFDIEELNKDLNTRGYPFFEGTAIEGKGVKETFQAATRYLLKHIAKKHRIDIDAKDLNEVKPDKAPAAADREWAFHETESTPETMQGEAAEAIEIEQAMEPLEVLEPIEIDEPVKNQKITSSEAGLNGLEGIPSLEELQTEIDRELASGADAEEEVPVPTSEKGDGEEDLWSAEEIETEESDYVLLEKDGAAAGMDSEPDKAYLADTGLEEFGNGQIDGLQDQDEMMYDSMTEEFVPETDQADITLSSEKESIKQAEEEPEIKFTDDSIESIYKAFMTDEEKSEKVGAAGMKESHAAPDIHPEKAVSEDKESAASTVEPGKESVLTNETGPAVPDEPFIETTSLSEKVTTPAIESHEDSAPASREDMQELESFSKSISPSFKETPEIIASGAKKKTSLKSTAETPDVTQNVIIGQINSLSKSISNIDDSTSALKTNMNILYDKIMAIDKSLSALSKQAAEMKEAMEIESASGSQKSADIQKTVMELKRTVEKARKKKLWMLFS
ncbi:mutual gliding-motility protein MglA [bacterium BMS3Abin07]|nr:mutual gliding-motility protein MglA [bacterium BMS3Abin07]GBE31649.1 mutual gliding-motility protein MglA [bacterium BMS3Bbin05]